MHTIFELRDAGTNPSSQLARMVVTFVSVISNNQGEPTVLFIAPLLMASTLAANENDSNSSYTGSNPVLIAACSVVPEVTYYNEGGDDHIYLPETIGAKLNIKFSNTTNKQISSVTFAVRDGSNPSEFVTDLGKFSPGVTITHSLESPISDTDHVGCSVSAVTFTDGSAWAEPPAVAAGAMK
jgi:hypothetical protein